MHDAAEHFVDTKRRAEATVEAQERRVAADDQRCEASARVATERKSIFNNANPGGKR